MIVYANDNSKIMLCVVSWNDAFTYVVLVTDKMSNVCTYVKGN